MKKTKEYYAKFKVIIMAFNKVLKLNSIQAPRLFWGIILASLLFPFFPIAYYIKLNYSESLAIIGFFYFLFYLFASIAVGNKLAKIGKIWSEEEYEKVPPDLVTFPYLLILIFHSTIHFTLFYLISIVFK